MDIGTLLCVAVALFLLSLVSLVTPWEGFRGLGRVAYGFSTALLGCYIVAQKVPASVEHIYNYLVGILIVGGLIVAGLGYRKFRRRNLPQGGGS